VSSTKRCSRCLFREGQRLWLLPAHLPERLRDITILDDGICNVCTAFTSELDRAVLEEEFEQLEFECLATHKPALLAFSGGKDSTAALITCVEKEIPVVAALYDNGFIPRDVIDRARALCARLGVELCVLTGDGSFAKVVDDASIDRPAPCIQCARDMTRLFGQLCEEREITWIVQGTNYFAHWGERLQATLRVRAPSGRALVAIHLPFALGMTHDDILAILRRHQLEPREMRGISSNCRVPELVQLRVANELGHVPEEEDLSLEVLVGHRSRQSALDELARKT
jgi:PP-loop superfamily ATP-utilizing enzyme